MFRGFIHRASFLIGCGLIVVPILVHGITEPVLSGEIDRVSQKLKVHDFDAALRLIAGLGDRDDPKLHLIKALQHELGIGVEIDSDKAVEYARLAAGHADWESAQYLAWRAITGSGEKRDLKEAMEWRDKLVQWKKANPAPRVIPETLLQPEQQSYRPIYEPVTKWNYGKAQAKDPVAQFNMFICLIDGKGIEPDALRAMQWLMRAANAGNGPAARWLSMCYSVGLFTRENKELALKYLQIAAEANDPEAQSDLGRALIRGKDLPRDTASGIRWLEKAVEQNDSKATSELAEIYYDGEIVEQNYRKAFALYAKAVELGDLDSRFNLAWMTFYGQGVEEDVDKGIRLFTEAAESGNRSAALRLAKIHLNGWKVDQDPSLARSWAEKAVALGSDYAHYVLGMLYRDGLLGEVDYEQAFHHFELAAREGDADSQIQMGYLLLWGKGIDRDLEEAYSWYQLAANQGDEYAGNWLLYMEGLGWGTAQKPESLIEYFSRENQLPLTEAEQKWLLDALAAKPGGDPPAGGADTANLQDSWEQELDNQIMTAGLRGGSMPPRQFYSPPPDYPQVMRMLKIDEDVTLVLAIDEAGLVKGVGFEKEPLPQFEEAVEHILPKWRFIPAIQDGKPVSSRVRIPVPFRVLDYPDFLNHE